MSLTFLSPKQMIKKLLSHGRNYDWKINTWSYGNYRAEDQDGENLRKLWKFMASMENFKLMKLKKGNIQSERTIVLKNYPKCGNKAYLFSHI